MVSSKEIFSGFSGLSKGSIDDNAVTSTQLSTRTTGKGGGKLSSCAKGKPGLVPGQGEIHKGKGLSEGAHVNNDGKDAPNKENAIVEERETAGTKREEDVDRKTKNASRPTWKTAVDFQTGRKYYYNRLTRTTTWTKPKELQELKQQPKRKQSEDLLESNASDFTRRDSKKSPVKKIWKKAFDPDSGRAYYYHRLTRQTTWSKPKDFDGMYMEPDSAECEQGDKTSSTPQLAEKNLSTGDGDGRIVSDDVIKPAGVFPSLQGFLSSMTAEQPKRKAFTEQDLPEDALANFSTQDFSQSNAGSELNQERQEIEASLPEAQIRVLDNGAVDSTAISAMDTIVCCSYPKQEEDIEPLKTEDKTADSVEDVVECEGQELSLIEVDECEPVATCSSAEDEQEKDEINNNVDKKRNKPKIVRLIKSFRKPRNSQHVHRLTMAETSEGDHPSTPESNATDCIQNAHIEILEETDSSSKDDPAIDKSNPPAPSLGIEEASPDSIVVANEKQEKSEAVIQSSVTPDDSSKTETTVELIEKNHNDGGITVQHTKELEDTKKTVLEVAKPSAMVNLMCCVFEGKEVETACEEDNLGAKISEDVCIVDVPETVRVGSSEEEDARNDHDKRNVTELVKEGNKYDHADISQDKPEEDVSRSLLTIPQSEKNEQQDGRGSTISPHSNDVNRIAGTFSIREDISQLSCEDAVVIKEKADCSGDFKDENGSLGAQDHDSISVPQIGTTDVVTCCALGGSLFGSITQCDSLEYEDCDYSVDSADDPVQETAAFEFELEGMQIEADETDEGSILDKEDIERQHFQNKHLGKSLRNSPLFKSIYKTKRKLKQGLAAPRNDSSTPAAFHEKACNECIQDPSLTVDKAIQVSQSEEENDATSVEDEMIDDTLRPRTIRGTNTSEPHTLVKQLNIPDDEKKQDMNEAKEFSGETSSLRQETLNQENETKGQDTEGNLDIKGQKECRKEGLKMSEAEVLRDGKVVEDDLQSTKSNEGLVKKDALKNPSIEKNEDCYDKEAEEPESTLPTDEQEFLQPNMNEQVHKGKTVDKERTDAGENRKKRLFPLKSLRKLKNSKRSQERAASETMEKTSSAAINSKVSQEKHAYDFESHDTDRDKDTCDNKADKAGENAAIDCVCAMAPESMPSSPTDDQNDDGKNEGDGNHLLLEEDDGQFEITNSMNELNAEEKERQGTRSPFRRMKQRFSKLEKRIKGRSRSMDEASMASSDSSVSSISTNGSNASQVRNIRNKAANATIPLSIPEVENMYLQGVWSLCDTFDSFFGGDELLSSQKAKEDPRDKLGRRRRKKSIEKAGSAAMSAPEELVIFADQRNKRQSKKRHAKKKRVVKAHTWEEISL